MTPALPRITENMAASGGLEDVWFVRVGVLLAAADPRTSEESVRLIDYFPHMYFVVFEMPYLPS